MWADGALVGFVDWDTASPSRREDDLAFSALTWVPLLTAEIAEQAGFGDAADRRRRFHLLLDAYGYTGDRTAIRDAIIGRVERNVAMIRQLADGGEPTFQRMLPWAADLERSGNEVAELPARGCLTRSVPGGERAVRWSVGVEAEGDRVLTREEIVELADAVAASGGIASGIGTSRYGAQLVVEAATPRRGGRARDGRVLAGGPARPACRRAR